MSRARWEAYVALALVSALADVAEASSHELYWQSGAGFLSGPSRLVAGYGGGPGYRFHVTDAVAFHVEARWLGFVGNVGTCSAGSTYSFKLGFWRPAVGAQVTAFYGNQLQVITSSQPESPGSVAWAVQLRLVPIRFVHHAASVSVLGADVGLAPDRGHAALALLFSLVEIGYRL